MSCHASSLAIVALFAAATTIAQPSPAQSEGRLPFPNVSLDTKDDYFPAQAKRLGIHGQVLFAFSLESDARPVRVRVLYSDSPILTSAAVKLLSDFKYLPQGPTPASPWYRFRMGVAFVYGDCSESVEVAAADTTVKVCTRAVPSLPDVPPLWPSSRKRGSDAAQD